MGATAELFTNILILTHLSEVQSQAVNQYTLNIIAIESAYAILHAQHV